MLDWFSEAMLKIVTSVPALFVAADSPTFMAVRLMFGLVLIVLVAYLMRCGRFAPRLPAIGGRCPICRDLGERLLPRQAR